MARVSKEPEVRRAEFIDHAAELFSEFGFEHTSVSDIVKKTGVAQGTFYYHFKSKEEILDAVIEREVATIAARADAACRKTIGSAVRKLQVVLEIVLSHSYDERVFIGQLYQKKYWSILEVLDKKYKQAFIPLLSEIIVEGNHEGTMHVEYVDETISILLFSLDSLFDSIVISSNIEEIKHKAVILEKLIIRILGIEDETLTLVSFIS